MGEFVLEMQNVSKSYYGTQVLKNVSIAVKPGEIHAILGENGAGKSTLMNILFGMSVIHSTGGFEGEVRLGGEAVAIKSPMQAMELGIGMVHQEFMLIPGFSIVENIKLNREILKDNIVSRVFGEKMKGLDHNSMAKDAKAALNTVGLTIDEWARVAGLPVGHMQFVEIAREIDKENIRLLVFDEPTAVLTENEAANLLATMRKLADSGIAILFITHRLDEVMEVADNVTILRDGALVSTLRKQDTSVVRMAELMVGREIETMAREKGSEMGQDSTILSIRDLHVRMPGEEIRGVSLEVKRGEIFGIGGLSGQGKIGIANGIMGLYPATGEVLLNGEKLELNNTKGSLARGLAFVSEDRRGVGLMLDSSIEENIAFTAMQVKNKFVRKYGPFSQVAQGEMRQHALAMIKELDIRCRGPLQATRRLSGGNQQKVCIARALTLDPIVLFVSEPTRGIDVGAKRLVLETLVKLNKEFGMTIVMTSSELAEIRSVCDRIAIISKGQVEGILAPDASDADYGLMMSGDFAKARREGVV
jgi:simple sugar transport system ATP-binding protein